MKFLLGMSGGLDSTCAALKLKECGHEVEGAVLLFSDFTDTSAAEKSAAEVGIKLRKVDCRENFQNCVINDFIDKYCSGRTPNPCVVCNRYVKMQRLFEEAAAGGFDGYATGHYAGTNFDEQTGRYSVTRALDEKKDQSYMLWQLTQEQISKLVIPLALERKTSLRERAGEIGLSSAKAEESMDICFIPDGDYAGFIERVRGKFPEGNFIDNSGKILGRHRGIIHYTVGQRKGLGTALGIPVYVSKIDPETNNITLSEAGGEFTRKMKVTGLNFQSLPVPDNMLEAELFVKVRYAAKPVSARVQFDSQSAEVFFSEPARAVTPGQSAVFYINNSIAFGGFIEA